MKIIKIVEILPSDVIVTLLIFKAKSTTLLSYRVIEITTLIKIE